MSQGGRADCGTTTLSLASFSHLALMENCSSSTVLLYGKFSISRSLFSEEERQSITASHVGTSQRHSQLVELARYQSFQGNWLRSDVTSAELASNGFQYAGEISNCARFLSCCLWWIFSVVRTCTVCFDTKAADATY